MTEANPQSKQERAAQLKEEIAVVATELIESGEVFSYPGFDTAYINTARKEEGLYESRSIPIDELIPLLEANGMKVSRGSNPGSQDYYVLPSGSNDVENDGTLVRQLSVDKITDARLERLVILAKEFKALMSS